MLARWTATHRAHEDGRATAAGWRYRQALHALFELMRQPCRREPVTGSSLCKERQCRLIFQGAQKSRRHILRSSSASKHNSTEATCGRLHSRHVTYRGRGGKDRCRTSTGSPMAGLKWLVKKFRAKTQSAAELEAAAASTAIQCSPPRENPRCEKCGNSGRILDRVEGRRPTITDQYCDCRMGGDLEAVERRQPNSTAR